MTRMLAAVMAAPGHGDVVRDDLVDPRHLEEIAEAFERTDKSHISHSLHPDQIEASGDSTTGDVSTSPGEAVFWTGAHIGRNPDSDL